MIKKIFKTLWYSVAVIIIVIAILSSVVRALTPWISGYRHNIEALASTLLKQPVTISKVEADWYIFEPVIRLSELEIWNEDKTAVVLKIDAAAIEINLFKSLMSWSLKPVGMVITGSAVKVQQQQNGKYSIIGINAMIDAAAQSQSKSREQFLDWLFAQKTVTLENLNINLIDQQQKIIPISNLSVHLINHGDRHILSGEANLAQQTASHINVVANFNGKGHQLENYSGQFFIGAKDVLLTQWLAKRVSHNISVINGTGSLQLWGNFINSNFSKVQSKVNFKDLTLLNTVTNKQQLFHELNANLEWQDQPHGWQLTSDEVTIQLPDGEVLPENQLMVHYDLLKQQYTLYLHYINLKYLHEFASLLDAVPPEFKTYIENLKPEGEVYDAKLRYSSAGLDLLYADINNLSWQNWNEIPGISGISAKLYLQAEQGHLELDANNVTLHYPRFFKQALLVSQLKGTFDWEKIKDSWRVSGEQILVKNDDITLNTQFNFESAPVLADSLINLTTNFTLEDLAKIKPLIPYQIMKPKLSKWLKRAIIGGDQVSGTLMLRGKLSDFPYDQDNGLFMIDSHFSNMTLDYHAGWPIANNIFAHIIFKNRDFSAEVNSADVGNIPVSNIQVKIPRLGSHQEVLTMTGNVVTDSHDASEFIMASPLIKHLGMLKSMQFSGPINTNLAIEIPLYPGNDHNLVNGTIDFQENEIKLPQWWQLNLQQVSGLLKFTQAGIVDSELNATLLQYPLKLSIKSMSKPQPTTQIDIAGNFGVDAIRDLLKDNLFQFIQGTTPIQGRLAVVGGKSNYVTLALSSSLQGVMIKLPPPYGKTARESRSFNFDVKFSDDAATIIKVAYDKLLNAILAYAKQDSGYELKRGEIKLGGKDAVLPKGDGLFVTGSLPYFSLEQWSATVKNNLASHRSESRSLNSLLRHIDVTIKKADLLGQTFDNLAVIIHPEATQWLIRLVSATISGDMVIPKDLHAGIIAKLQRLYLTKLPAVVTKTQINPNKIPSLQITVDDLRYAEMHLGKLNLETVNYDNALVIKQLILATSSYGAQATGAWMHDKQGVRTNLKGTFTSTDMAQTLQQWNISPVMKVKHAAVAFEFNWPDAPYQFALKKLNGNMQLKLEHGIITHLDEDTEQKLGLGKLLSILSLQTLPRRLVLDFSDLSSDGFSFDNFTGNFTINHGTMTTHDSALDGPVAAVTMRGSLNLSEREYDDIILEISPHITASLPVVATIAGGPIAGIATWVASKIISKEMKSVVSYSYKITGPWAQPTVQQLSITQKDQQRQQPRSWK